MASRKARRSRSGKKPNTYSAKPYWLPIFVFYAASFAAPYFLDFRQLLVISDVLALATGAFFVLGTRWCNVWTLLVVGFSQFAVLMLPATIHRAGLIDSTFDVRVPGQIAVCCAVGGIVAELYRNRRLQSRVWSFDAFFYWLNPKGAPPDTPFDKIEFVQKLVTLAATAWTAWRFVVNHS